MSAREQFLTFPDRVCVRIDPETGHAMNRFVRVVYVDASMTTPTQSQFFRDLLTAGLEAKTKLLPPETRKRLASAK